MDALRSPAVNLPNLAKQVETAHLPAIAVSTTCDVEESAPSDSKLTSMYARCLLQFKYLYLSASTQATSLPSQKLAVNLSERETAAHFTDSTHDVVVPETTGMILSTNIH